MSAAPECGIQLIEETRNIQTLQLDRRSEKAVDRSSKRLPGQIMICSEPFSAVAIEGVKSAGSGAICSRSGEGHDYRH
jgi:hypothetical protein